MNPNPLQAKIQSLLDQRALLLWPGFFTPAECQDMRSALQNAPSRPAEAEAYGTKPALPIRRSHELDPGLHVRSFLKAKLEQSASGLFNHFGIQASRQEQAQFLRYLPGDYFKAHCDWANEPIYRERILSIVLFLNDHEPPNGFTGGRFSFLVPHSDDPQRLQGVPIYPQAGLLMAFRTDLRHEVSPVTAGERYTIVTWLSA